MTLLTLARCFDGKDILIMLIIKYTAITDKSDPPTKKKKKLLRTKNEAQFPDLNKMSLFYWLVYAIEQDVATNSAPPY